MRVYARAWSHAVCQQSADAPGWPAHCCDGTMHTACSMQHAACSMQHAACSVQHAAKQLKLFYCRRRDIFTQDACTAGACNRVYPPPRRDSLAFAISFSASLRILAHPFSSSSCILRRRRYASSCCIFRSYRAWVG
jgi:hypothetical protein